MFKTASRNNQRRMKGNALRNNKPAPMRVERTNYLYDGEIGLQLRIDDYKNKKGSRWLLRHIVEELMHDVQNMIDILDKKILPLLEFPRRKKKYPTEERVKLEKAQKRIGYYFAIKKDMQSYLLSPDKVLNKNNHVKVKVHQTRKPESQVNAKSSGAEIISGNLRNARRDAVEMLNNDNIETMDFKKAIILCNHFQQYIECIQKILGGKLNQTTRLMLDQELAICKPALTKLQDSNLLRQQKLKRQKAFSEIRKVLDVSAVNPIFVQIGDVQALLVNYARYISALYEEKNILKGTDKQDDDIIAEIEVSKNNSQKLKDAIRHYEHIVKLKRQQIVLFRLLIEY